MNARFIFILICATSHTVHGFDESSRKSDGSHTMSPDEVAAGETHNVLNIDDAVSAAIGNNPKLRSAEATIERQQHLVYQATRKPNPVVGYTAAEMGNEGDAGQQGVYLTQEIVRGCKLGLDSQVRQREVSVAMQQLEIERLKLESRVRLAFIDVAWTQEQSKLLNKLQLSLDRAVMSVKGLVDSGEVSLSASLQSRLVAERNQMKIRATESQLAAARLRLATILGWQSLDVDVAASELLPKSAIRNSDELWAHISSSSPEIRLAMCQQDRAHWQVRRAQAEPTPNLQTQWSLQQDAATDYTVMGIQLGVALPVRNKNIGGINAALADTWRTHHEADSVRRRLRIRFVAATGRLRTAEQQLRTIKEELEALARDNLQTTRKAFSLGESSYLDLLNAQRGYISLSLETLRLYREVAIVETYLHTLLVQAPDSMPAVANN